MRAAGYYGELFRRGRNAASAIALACVSEKKREIFSDMHHLGVDHASRAVFRATVGLTAYIRTRVNLLVLGVTALGAPI